MDEESTNKDTLNPSSIVSRPEGRDQEQGNSYDGSSSYVQSSDRGDVRVTHVMFREVSVLHLPSNGQKDVNLAVYKPQKESKPAWAEEDENVKDHKEEEGKKVENTPSTGSSKTDVKSDVPSDENSNENSKPDTSECKNVADDGMNINETVFHDNKSQCTEDETSLQKDKSYFDKIKDQKTALAEKIPQGLLSIRDTVASPKEFLTNKLEGKIPKGITDTVLSPKKFLGGKIKKFSTDAMETIVNKTGITDKVASVKSKVGSVVPKGINDKVIIMMEKLESSEDEEEEKDKDEEGDKSGSDEEKDEKKDVRVTHAMFREVSVLDLPSHSRKDVNLTVCKPQKESKPAWAEEDENVKDHKVEEGTKVENTPSTTDIKRDVPSDENYNENSKPDTNVFKKVALSLSHEGIPTDDGMNINETVFHDNKSQCTEDETSLQKDKSYVDKIKDQKTALTDNIPQGLLSIRDTVTSPKEFLTNKLEGKIPKGITDTVLSPKKFLGGKIKRFSTDAMETIVNKTGITEKVASVKSKVGSVVPKGIKDKVIIVMEKLESSEDEEDEKGKNEEGDKSGSKEEEKDEKKDVRVTHAMFREVSVLDLPSHSRKDVNLTVCKPQKESKPAWADECENVKDHKVEEGTKVENTPSTTDVKRDVPSDENSNENSKPDTGVFKNVALSLIHEGIPTDDGMNINETVFHDNTSQCTEDETSLQKDKSYFDKIKDQKTALTDKIPQGLLLSIRDTVTSPKEFLTNKLEGKIPKGITDTVLSPKKFLGGKIIKFSTDAMETIVDKTGITEKVASVKSKVGSVVPKGIKDKVIIMMEKLESSEDEEEEKDKDEEGDKSGSDEEKKDKKKDAMQVGQDRLLRALRVISILNISMSFLSTGVNAVMVSIGDPGEAVAQIVSAIWNMLSNVMLIVPAVLGLIFTRMQKRLQQKKAPTILKCCIPVYLGFSIASIVLGTMSLISSISGVNFVCSVGECSTEQVVVIGLEIVSIATALINIGASIFGVVYTCKRRIGLLKVFHIEEDNSDVTKDNLTKSVGGLKQCKEDGNVSKDGIIDDNITDIQLDDIEEDRGEAVQMNLMNSADESQMVDTEV